MAERHDFHGTQRRVLFQIGHQLGQEQRVQIVTGRNAEGAFGTARIKGTRFGKQVFGRAQDVGGGLKHAQRSIRGLHAATRSHQNGVTREFTQALERS